MSFSVLRHYFVQKKLSRKLMTFKVSHLVHISVCRKDVVPAQQNTGQGLVSTRAVPAEGGRGGGRYFARLSHRQSRQYRPLTSPHALSMPTTTLRLKTQRLENLFRITFQSLLLCHWEQELGEVFC